MERKTNHTQSQVRYQDEIIEVDLELVPLLKKLWHLGIETNFSCQGDPFFIDQTRYEAKQHRAYIQMKHSEASVYFIQRLLELPMFRGDRISWDISFDRNPKTDENRISIRFPNKDINYLIMSIWNWEF